jgi:hypothetical protein
VLVSCLADQVTPSVSVGGAKRLSFSWNEVSAWEQHAYIKSANTGEMYVKADLGDWGA